MASKTNAFVKAIAHTKAKILDTRKTTPGKATSNCNLMQKGTEC